MKLAQKILHLIKTRKKQLKIAGIIILYLGAGLGFYFGLFAKKAKSETEVLNPIVSQEPSKKPAFSKIPEVSIPPQPSYKPVIKKPASQTPSPVSQSSPSPSPSLSPSPSQEITSPSPSASPSQNPNPSPSLSASPSPSASPNQIPLPESS